MTHKLSVIIVCTSVSLWMVGCGEFSKNPGADQQRAGFVKLFNGEDLTGWEKSGDAK